MPDYNYPVEQMTRDALLNELIYHGQRVAYHAIRLEERWTHQAPDLVDDYRFVWMGEELRHISRVHEELTMRLNKQKQEMKNAEEERHP